MTLRKAVKILPLIAAMALASTAAAQTDKSAAIINDMINALGGKKFLDVREIQSSGKVFAFKRDQMSGTNDFINYLKYPDKQRTEYGTSKIKPATIYNGESGWNVVDKKIEELPVTDVKEFQAGLHTGLQYVARFVLTKPGLTTQYVGSGLIDYKPNDMVEFRDSGNFFRLYIDQQTHLPTKMEIRRSGETFIREEQYANWHEFQSIKTALYLIRLRDGERNQEIRYADVAYNTGLADSLFNPTSTR